jgi:hypothetical protein
MFPFTVSEYIEDFYVFDQHLIFSYKSNEDLSSFLTVQVHTTSL